MRRVLPVVLLWLLGLAAPALAQSHTIPGWRVDRLAEGITMTSPTDDRGRAVVYYQLYAEPYTGSHRVHFTRRVDRIAAGMAKVNSRHGTVTEELPQADGSSRTIWQDVLNATNADGVTAHVMIMGWRVGTSQSQIMLVIFHDELNDADPMVSAALDHVGALGKAGRGIAREAGAGSPPLVQRQPPAPQAAPVVQQQAAPAAAKPCVPKPVRINYPRAVSRQQCNYLGGQYRCTLVTDYVDNYVTVHTGCQ